MNEIEPALRRAYALGQKYWQQADSDFARDNRKADETQAKFNQLVESMQGWLSPAEADNLRAENESLREQRNRIGLCIDRALHGGKKDDHEAGLSGRMDAIRSLKAQLAEAQRDAERLDWLEDNWHRPVLEDWEDRFETLRAAIDAAKGESDG